MKKMAHIVEGKVVSVSKWNGESAWSSNELVVEIPKGVVAGIGWDYIEGEFIDKRPQEEDPTQPKEKEETTEGEV